MCEYGDVPSASDWLCASGPVIMCECSDERVVRS